MTTVTLLPRLSQIAVDHFLDEYGDDPTIAHSLDFARKTPGTTSYAPSGGSPLPKESLVEIRRLLVGAAEKNGFPDSGSSKGRAQFDTDVTCLLGEHPLFIPPEALRDDVWAFLTTVVAPDIVSWRFGTTSRERYHGGVRNAFQRLWMRSWSLDRGEGDENRWGLIDELTEDAFVQIVERPSIGGDPRIARALAEGWVRMAERTGRGPMEAIMRRAVIAFRLRNQIQVLAALNDTELTRAVDVAFERARLSLDVETLDIDDAPAHGAYEQPSDVASTGSPSEQSPLPRRAEGGALSRLWSIMGRKKSSSSVDESTQRREQESGLPGCSVGIGETHGSNKVPGTGQDSNGVDDATSELGVSVDATGRETVTNEATEELDKLLGMVVPEATEEPAGGQGASSPELQERTLPISTRVVIGDAEMPFEAMLTYLERIEQVAEGRNLLSPKSRDALGKLKAGEFLLSATDRNALENLQKNLSKLAVVFDIPRNADQAPEPTGGRESTPIILEQGWAVGQSNNERGQRPGLDWKGVFLPEGTAVSMRYGGELYMAEVSGGGIVDRDGEFSPGEWANKVANNTSRNAWRDLWFKMPGEHQWVLADEVRRRTND